MASDAPGPRSALRVPWGFGFLSGLLAAVAGASLTLAAVVLDWPGPGLPPRLADRALRSLYGAHGVGVASPVPVADGRLPDPATGLVPVAVLLAVGYLHASGYVGTSARQAVLAGATVSVGYVVAGVAGVLLFGVAASPLVVALAFGGYAVVLGGLGGYLARS